jgi:hypothetical protein
LKTIQAHQSAAIIVAIVAILASLGSGFGNIIGGGNFLTSFFTTLVWTFVGWLLWSVVSYFVGTTFFGGKATLNEMIRVIGFAYARSSFRSSPALAG